MSERFDVTLADAMAALDAVDVFPKTESAMARRVMNDTGRQPRVAAGPAQGALPAALPASGCETLGDAGAGAGLFYRDLYVGGVDKATGNRKAIDYAERRVDVVASTEALDSYGEIVEQSWILDRYLRNPVVLWNHNRLFQSDKKPIGRAENVRVENPGTPQAALKMSIIFATEAANPEAERILLLFVEGIQRAVSAGFRPTTIRSERVDDRDVTILAGNVLYELSATPIGANPDALAELRSLEEQWIAEHLETYAAVPYSAHKPVVGAWDAAAATKRVKAWATSGGKVSMTKYRSAFAWYDGGKPEAFGSYKLPHHDVRGGGMVTVKSGVVAAGNAMQGARGGVRMPAADRAAVRSHLAKHYKQFGMVAPWDKSADDDPPADERGGPNHNMESKMDYEEIQAALEKADKALADVTAERDAAVAKCDALDSQNEALAAERDAALSERDALKREAVKTEVEALVGVKFAPTEVDDQIKLALENRELFDRLTAQRSDLTLLERDPAGMGPDPAPEPTNANSHGEGFAALVNAAASCG